MRVETFDAAWQPSARCQIQVLQGVTILEESRQWLQTNGSAAQVEFPEMRGEVA